MEACWVAARTETAQEGARKTALGGQVRGEQDFVGCGFLQSDVMWEAITESWADDRCDAASSFKVLLREGAGARAEAGGPVRMPPL